MQPDIKLYNTLTRQAERLETIEPNKVRLYVCGPTVYDEAHLGHARCYMTWDVLYRFLQFTGYDVAYTRNITDVDDKILKRAEENNESPTQLAQRYTERFHRVMAQLNVAPPKNEPKATEYVPQMVTVIQALIDKGFAYVTPSGTVYYDTHKKANYGNLCHQNLDDLQSGARVEVDPEKRSPLDFALWKPAPEGAPLVWPAPWGWGRPGWHIECSAMSYALLGEQLDIHAGGMDLIFPHHQNEIAQSEAFTGKEPFVKLWMHNGFVNVSGEKMSKSLGNFATIGQLLQVYDANTLRYFILTHHYRSPVDFSDEALEGAKNRVAKIRLNIQDLLQVLGTSAQPLIDQSLSRLKAVSNQTPWEKAARAWMDAMADDMNTAQALAQLNELLSQANPKPGEALPHAEPLGLFLALSQIMGFDFLQTSDESTQLEAISEDLRALLAEIRQRLQQEKGWSIEAQPNLPPPELVEALISDRARVRAEKDWAFSDLIRDRLASLGIQLKDRKEGLALWHYEPPQ